MQGFVARYAPTAQVALARLVLAAAVVCSGTALAAEPAAAARRASLVLDANTGRILHAQAADEARYPASLTKMMTLYIVFELLEQHRLEPDTRIRISEHAAGTAPSKLGLEPGSEITVEDAIRALVTKSANDIAVALAEHIAGSEPRFARMMTEKAHALGMKATVFKNAHGLPDPDQVTTARDMATLALHLNDEFPRYFRLFSLRAFHYRGKTYRNHNTLLGRVEGVDGIKTGYTAASGFNLVTSLRRDGKHLIGVVFGGRTASARNALMRGLLNRTLRTASAVKTRKPFAVARAHERRRMAARAPARVTEPPTRPEPRRDEPAPEWRPAEPPTRAEARFEQPPVLQGPPIEIARVRRVSVLPRARLTRTQTAPQPAAFSSAQSQPGMLAGFSQAMAAPFQPDQQQSVLGALPSSFEEQAARLARGQPAIIHAAAAGSPRQFGDVQPVRQVPATAPRPSGFAIQVGAFSSEAEAQRQLAAARSRAGDLLAGREPFSQPVQHGGQQLYRARFSGFDGETANRTCQELKRRRIDCHVARVE